MRILLSWICSVLLAGSLLAACSSPPARSSPPAPPPPRNETAPQAAQPSNNSTPGDTSPQLDKLARDAGYRPALYRGQHLYCRTEKVTNSAFSTKVCLTAQQIRDRQQAAQDVLNRPRSDADCLVMKSCN